MHMCSWLPVSRGFVSPKWSIKHPAAMQGGAGLPLESLPNILAPGRNVAT